MTQQLRSSAHVQSSKRILLENCFSYDAVNFDPCLLIAGKPEQFGSSNKDFDLYLGNLNLNRGIKFPDRCVSWFSSDRKANSRIVLTMGLLPLLSATLPITSLFTIIRSFDVLRLYGDLVMRLTIMGTNYNIPVQQ
jgi:hypothetical protein